MIILDNFSPSKFRKSFYFWSPRKKIPWNYKNKKGMKIIEINEVCEKVLLENENSLPTLIYLHNCNNSNTFSGKLHTIILEGVLI